MKIQRYPLRLCPLAKSAIWGGQRLSSEWHKGGERVAESWELCVRLSAVSVIENGAAKGMTLPEYLEAVGYDCVFPAYQKGDRFPLLVKLIDAADRLSVQVHPADEDLGPTDADGGKNELWYVVDAREGASIVLGLSDGVSNKDFADAVGTDELEKTLCVQPVRAGESYWIPAGLVHAIGEGILIAEIQQNSDLTYRLWDYGRRDRTGNLRPLQTEKALGVVRSFSKDEIEALCFEKGARRDGFLTDNRYFCTEKRKISGKKEFFVCADSFEHLLCIEGEGKLVLGGESYDVRRGDSYFLPAGMGAYRAEGEWTSLASRLPITHNT